MSTKLIIQNLTITFESQEGQLTALKNLDLRVNPGEFLAIIGPSGCGKTTLLYALAGLLKPSEGKIFLNDQGVNGPGRERVVVFQDATLLPWRNVWGNIAYGLESQGIKKSQKEEKVRHYLKLVKLSKFANYFPRQLSGGMKQRVNLARALACEPEILLLDEPFAAIDAQTRERLGQELLEIWEKTKKTFVFVTHQISEALFLADRVIVLSARPGKVKKELKIDFPRPRRLSLKWQRKFIEKEQLLWSLIEKGQDEEI